SEMIRMAKAFCGDSRVEYFNGDFLSAGLPALDAAVAFNSYPHFLDKPAFVEKTAQAIKIDGILAIAHSSGKKTINSRHGGGSAAALSIPLESAEAEAGRFKRFFAPETLIDNDGMYFIKLRRK
ncbi:MAG: hypothetical protein FWF44_03765, partial [Defluviitaleaceae bacterium]|nr:hypothetical protein [Defluviitaleaceae bacterium]